MVPDEEVAARQRRPDMGPEGDIDSQRLTVGGAGDCSPAVRHVDVEVGRIFCPKPVHQGLARAGTVLRDFGGLAQRREDSLDPRYGSPLLVLDQLKQALGFGVGLLGLLLLALQRVEDLKRRDRKKR